MNAISAIDEYMSRVYRWVLIIITGSCACAGITFSALKLLGFYSTVAWLPLIIFVGTCLIYIGIGCVLISKCIVDGKLDPKMLLYGKIFLVLVLLIQYNFILYLIPSRDFWGFAFFFVILAAFFLDYKMILICIGEIFASLIAAWLVNGQNLLPAKDELFIPDVVIRTVCVVLSFAAVFLITLFTGKFLVDAKRDEMDKNNNRVHKVLTKVNNLMDTLSTSSKTILITLQKESASTETLYQISESLLKSSDNMLKKSNGSKNNLLELDRSSTDMVEKMKEMDSTSKELVNISSSNESALNNLMTISEKVKTSTKTTVSVTDKLLREAGEIGQTLNIINEIAESINLLSLNASIEAARAGEAGRGFSVVAQEVGHLAYSTKDSLKSVNDVVTRVQSGTSDVASFMTENAKLLEEQHSVLISTVEGIRSMISLLKKSVQAINHVNSLQEEQDKVIELTVSENEELVESIQSENLEFGNIAQMVQDSTSGINTLTEQVDSLNEMVLEIEELLQITDD